MWPFKRMQGMHPSLTPKRSCENCLFHDAYRTREKLNPDKTVTPSKTEYHVCGYDSANIFRLEDMEACVKWKRDDGRAKCTALTYELRRHPLPPKLRKGGVNDGNP